MAFTIADAQVLGETYQPLLIATLLFKDGSYLRLSTHPLNVAEGGVQYNGYDWLGRISKQDIQPVQNLDEYGIDRVPQVTLHLADADKFLWLNYEMNINRGFKGAALRLDFLFVNVDTWEFSTDYETKFLGVCEAPSVDSASMSLSAQARCNTQRTFLPPVRIQSRCPWTFPSTATAQADSINPDSQYYECGYNPSGGEGIAGFTSCNYTKAQCQARGMYALGRFGGITFTPPSSWSSKSYLQAKTIEGTNSNNDAKWNESFPLPYGTTWVHPPIMNVIGDGNSTRMEAVLCPAKLKGSGTTDAGSVRKVVVNDYEIPFVSLSSDVEIFRWQWVTVGERNGAPNLDAMYDGKGDPYGSLACILIVVPSEIAASGSVPDVKVLMDAPQIHQYKNVASVSVSGGEATVTFTGINDNVAAVYADTYEFALDGGTNSAFDGVWSGNVWNTYGGTPGWVVIKNTGLPDGTSTGGTFRYKEATSNPAWILLDILTWCNVAYADVDIQSFTDAAEYCAEVINYTNSSGETVSHPRFQYSVEIRERQSASDIIRAIRTGFRAYVDWYQGKYRIFVEKTLADQQPAPVLGSNYDTAISSVDSDGNAKDGFAAYHFDGSSIIRNEDGSSSLRVSRQSNASSPNRINCQFQDSENDYVQSALNEVEADDISRITAEYDATLTVLGPNTFDHAMRVSATYLAKIHRMNPAADTRGTITFDFDTTFKVAHLRVGQICVLTDAQLGLSLQPIRITALKWNTNYEGGTVTAQWHDDQFFVDTYGQTSNIIPSSSVVTKRKPYPWSPGYVAPAADDPVYSETDKTFSLSVDCSQTAADGSGIVKLNISGYEPVNSFSSEPAPSVNSQATIATSGGTLAGPSSYYMALCALDSSNKLSAPSIFSRADVDITSGSACVASFPVSSWGTASVGYSLFAGTDSRKLTWQKTGTGTPSSVSLAQYGVSDWGIPDTVVQKIRTKIKKIKHAGVFESAVTSVTTASVSSTGCISISGAGWTTNQWAGRVCSVLSKADGSALPVLNYSVVSNTADTLYVTPNPFSSALHNFIVYSEDFSQWGVNIYGGASTPVITSGQSDPNSGTAAYKVEEFGPGCGVFAFYSVDPGDRTMSIWLKGNAGGERVHVGDGLDGGKVTEFVLTSSWVRYEVAQTQAPGGSRSLEVYGLDASDTWYVFGAQVNKGSVATTYLHTTGAAVLGDSSVDVGDWITVRMAPVAVGTVLTDTSWVNTLLNNGVGLVSESGNYVRVVAGKGRGKRAKIVSNTSTSVTVDTALALDTTSILIIEESEWTTLADSSEFSNSNPLSVLTLSPEITNYAGVPLLIGAFGVSSSGAESLEAVSPVREIIVTGKEGIATTESPVAPTSVTATESEEGSSVSISATWSMPAAIGGTVGFSTRVRYYSDSGGTTPLGEWEPASSVLSASAVTTTFSGISKSTDEKWAKVGVAGINSANEISSYTESNIVAIGAGGTSTIVIPSQPASGDWSIAVAEYGYDEVRQIPVARVVITITTVPTSTEYFTAWSYKGSSPPASPSSYSSMASQEVASTGDTLISMWIDREAATYQFVVTACTKVYTYFPTASSVVHAVTLTAPVASAQVTDFSVTVDTASITGCGRFIYDFTAPSDLEYWCCNVYRIPCDSSFVPLTGAVYSLVSSSVAAVSQTDGWTLPDSAEYWKFQARSMTRAGLENTVSAPTVNVTVPQGAPTQPASGDWSVSVASYGYDNAAQLAVAEIGVTITANTASTTYYTVWMYEGASAPADPSAYVSVANIAQAATGSTSVSLWKNQYATTYQVVVTANNASRSPAPTASSAVHSVVVSAVAAPDQVTGFSVSLDTSVTGCGMFNYAFTAPSDLKYFCCNVYRIKCDSSFVPLTGETYGLVSSSVAAISQDTPWTLPESAEYWKFKAQSISRAGLENTVSAPTSNVTVPANSTTPSSPTTALSSSEWSVSATYAYDATKKLPVVSLDVTITGSYADTTWYTVWVYEGTSPPADLSKYVATANVNKAASGSTTVSLWYNQYATTYQLIVTSNNEAYYASPTSASAVHSVVVSAAGLVAQVTGFSVTCYTGTKNGVPVGRFGYTFTAPSDAQFKCCNIYRILCDSSFVPISGGTYNLVSSSVESVMQVDPWTLPNSAEYWTFQARSVNQLGAENTTSCPTYNVTVAAGTGLSASAINTATLGSTLTVASNLLTVASKALTDAQIQNGSLTDAVIASVAANKITAGTLVSGVVYAGTIAASQITAGTLVSGVVYAGSIAASQITAGTITAAISMTAPTITITGSTFTININSTDGLKVTSASSDIVSLTNGYVACGNGYYGGTLTSSGLFLSYNGTMRVSIGSGASRGDIQLFGSSSFISLPDSSSYISLAGASSYINLGGSSSYINIIGEYRISGTVVINASRNLTAATGTFSGALTANSTTTFNGNVTVSSSYYIKATKLYLASVSSSSITRTRTGTAATDTGYFFTVYDENGTAYLVPMYNYSS